MSDAQEIYARMGAIMQDMVAIGKDSTNQQQGFKYRSIDSVYNALNPLLAKHGVFTVPEVLEKTRDERTNKNGTVLAFTCLRMRYTFYAPDGSFVACVVEGEGMDSGDKSSNKAMAIAHKYALLQTFCIPTEEAKDPEGEAHEVAPDPRRESLLADFAIVAKEGGELALREAWLKAPEADRKLIGAAGLAQLKKAAGAAGQ